MALRDLRWSAACGALAAAMIAAPAFANDEAQAAQPQAAQTQSSADDMASDRLSEIVVTATRRVSNLQRTPVAVSAVDANLIRQASPRDIGDLAAFVPNFSANTITNFNAASFAMRGVGQTSIIVYFEPPAVGSHIDADSSYGSLESVKAVSDVIAPLAGTVTAVNDKVVESPELVNESPYADGWLIRVKLDDVSSVEGLLDADAYQALL
jgi:glycine cleavage system H protein